MAVILRFLFSLFSQFGFGFQYTWFTTFVQIELALNKVVYCPLCWRHLDVAVYQVISYGSALSMEKTSEYDQEIPQSHTVDQPTAP